MSSILDVAIILLCFVALIIFKRTKSYLSIAGLSLLITFFLLIFLKYFSSDSLYEIGFRTDNLMVTLIPATIYLALSTAILFTMRFKPKKFKIIKWIFALFILYLLFGLVQQIFFQAIFTHTLNKLIQEKILVILFSAVFFSSFHWGWDSKGIKFGILTLFGGVTMATLYLISPNVYLLGIVHGILASLYYFVVYEGNIARKENPRKC